jgi:P2-related tail formation protein
MAQLTIQPSINDLRSQSLLGLIERLGALDLTPILVYRLDSVPDSALLLLAWQFDMLAPQWQVGANVSESIDALTNIDALTDIDTLTSSQSAAGSSSDAASWRTLLKAAIPLHQTRGTPYAIKTALAALGWSSVTLLEGQSSWNGAAWPANQGWAVFRAVINLAAGQAVANGEALRAIGAINFFKPTRSRLDSLWFSAAPIADSAPAPDDIVRSIFLQRDAAPAPADVVSAPAWPLADTKRIAAVYDAHFHHIGVTYGANEPAVADSGVIVNGNPIAAGE